MKNPYKNYDNNDAAISAYFQRIENITPGEQKKEKDLLYAVYPKSRVIFGDTIERIEL